MIDLTLQEVLLVSGAGWASWLAPIIIGIVTGGPIGLGVAVGGLIVNTGVQNLEHLHKHGTAPTLGEIYNR